MLLDLLYLVQQYAFGTLDTRAHIATLLDGLIIDKWHSLVLGWAHWNRHSKLYGYNSVGMVWVHGAAQVLQHGVYFGVVQISHPTLIHRALPCNIGKISAAHLLPSLTEKVIEDFGVFTRLESTCNACLVCLWFVGYFCYVLLRMWRLHLVVYIFYWFGLLNNIYHCYFALEIC